ncbi:NADPH-dependent FMN reductase [Thalassospira sp. MCCC 1A01428]|uniref:NADPH-dependent FMN reductase n=1 Tax=Thalassospira sp. MCCC 1A01428 TaxID=1470575 RepID=UPI000A1E807B|nr:NADPH-dependent FMN reductase [Thalassospira sp. MCCC 1A01428]OSQ35325.1 FMN reductase [Thalassospira sp. MCCC 1A01428]
MTNQVLAISGSLRKASINSTLLRAAQIAADKFCLEIDIYTGLGDLPLFNPDLEGREAQSVLNFRTKLRSCDAVLIASPEYAHGVTGVLKNALDWVVASGEFMGKPVVVLNASGRATIAQAALIETIGTMDATVLHNACLTIALNGKNYSETDIITASDTAPTLQKALDILRTELQQK